MATTELATFGGGCFWCIESAFNQVKGVNEAVSGYSGGHLDNPTYQQICQGTSGHAEVIQITFDPEIISYEQLLEVFFQLHDPTQLNRQGNDVGTQYRSVIFFHSPEQQQSAINIISNIESQQIWTDPVVTELSPSTTFYRAESYHQNYANENPEQPYCALIINPKLAKFKNQFRHLLK